LHGEIKILGVGKGRVSQASLADEMVDLFSSIEKLGGKERFKEFEQNGKRFFLNYFKAILGLFQRLGQVGNIVLKLEPPFGPLFA